VPNAELREAVKRVDAPGGSLRSQIRHDQQNGENGLYQA
jgi:hypothetical protein